ncbi:MAG TPA: tyrosine-type recombinase/integrase [Mycobacteriales bacterium]|nr:tyrosine-type recombinase/integrase [Mycobacteriales bacterium]
MLLADAFLAGYADRTREAYEHDLTEYLTWCATQQPPVDPMQAIRAHVQLYVRHLEDAGRAPATVARKLAVVSGFYRYCAAEDAITKNPATYVRRPRVADESTRMGLTRDELVAFMAVATRRGGVDEALARLLASNGLRVSEACGARREHLVVDEHGRRVLEIHRKGGKIAFAPLADRTAAAIDALPVHDDGSLLGVDRFAAWRIVKQLASAAGIAKTISPHSLRHTFATLALEQGVPLHVVQDAMSHSNPATTRRYDRSRGAFIAQAVNAVDDLLGE